MNTFERVAMWNIICDKQAPEHGTEAYYKALANQAERIAEELKELVEAINNRDDKEILDAGCDLDVVVAGLNFLHGHDYEGAIDAVLSNNDEKYTYDRRVAEAALLKLGTRTHNIHEYQIKIDENLSQEERDELDITLLGDVEYASIYTVHRISDDKICKFLEHPEVNLEEFIK